MRLIMQFLVVFNINLIVVAQHAAQHAALVRFVKYFDFLDLIIRCRRRMKGVT